MTERHRPRLWTTLWAPVVVLALGVVLSVPALAAEYIRAESPAPDSAAELDGALDHAFDKQPISDWFVLQRLSEVLEGAPPFWSDTKLGFASRTYEFNRDNGSDDTREAWTTGGRLEYESGRWKNLRLKAAYYGSFELDADGGDTGLLQPGQENIHALGVANLNYRFAGKFLEGSEIRLYRQTLDLPYVNKHDIRMLPATHEGILMGKEGDAFGYAVGHITRFKDYDRENFVYMSEAAGAPGTDEGLSLAGAKVQVTDRFGIGAIDYYGWDTFNTFYVEAEYHRKLGEHLDYRLSGQFTDQRSVGDDLVGDFDTYHGAAQVAVGWRGAVFKLAGSLTSDEQGIESPWGGKPTYLSIQRLDFDRANEKAVLLALSYNTGYFSKLGLSSYIAIGHGSDAEAPITGEELPDRTEYDLTIDYKPPRGLFRGLWVRARYAHLDIEDDGERVRDIRLIVNYSIRFL